MSESRNHRLEWKPEPSLKFKWKNALHLLAGFLFLTSTIGISNATPQVSKIYALHCIEDNGFVNSVYTTSREQNILLMNRYLNAAITKNVTACSTKELDVDPVTDEELNRIIHRSIP